MKTTVKWTGVLLLMTALASGEVHSQEAYLKKVLENLEKIESASYKAMVQWWQPGDSEEMEKRCVYVEEYNNHADTTIGASFVEFNIDEIKSFRFGYDGTIRTLVDNDVQQITIDDFTTHNLPFRSINAPFFNNAKNIILYTLSTSDCIHVELKEFNDHVYFKLTVLEDELIEFFGKAYHVENATPWDTTTIYEIWINKSDDLPYKIKREKPHYISAVTRMETELNKLSLHDFDLYSYFPEGWEVRLYGDRRKEGVKRPASSLVGEKAPHFILNDMNEQRVSIDNYKSKVLLLNFTGIGCGPCQASIPFLKKIKGEYSSDKFDIVSIETWSRRARSLQVYTNKNELNFTMLSATAEVIEDYRTGGAAPAFFILDEDRMVRKVIVGYGMENTDRELEEAIKELL